MEEIRIKLGSDLFPEVEPYNSGYLSLDHGHEIYFEECGDPKGIPVLFLHGGPGAGCSQKDRRYFDPQRCRIILFDQRGSGRSKPFGSLTANTTWNLVEDIRQLLTYLSINRVVLFGGSWGSTLALVFAIKYPGNVMAMILRGIFLGERSEVNYLYNGPTELFAPTAWRRFIDKIPPTYRDSPLEYYDYCINRSSAENRKFFAYEWARYEESLLHLKPLNDSDIHNEVVGFPYESLAIIETVYFMKNCFLEDGYIINHARKIPPMPISIVQGRYDLACPPLNAHRLNQVLCTSNLNLVLAGHSSSDPEITRALVSETNRVLDELSTNQTCN